jgi:hypothetical protein
MSDVLATIPEVPAFASRYLNEVLARELSAGNAVHQDGPGWGEFHRLLILREPFKTDVSLGAREVQTL